MGDTLHYIDTFTDLLRQAICLMSQMKHEEYILALKQWQIADSMVQSLANQFDVLGHSYTDGSCMRQDDNDSVDSAKIREQIDLMVEDFPEDNEKSSSWTIFNDTFLMFSDEELETIFRKAFIRSKSKNPIEDKIEETQLTKQDWSNQICDRNKGLNEDLTKSSDQSLIMMSYSENSNTYTSSSDTDTFTPSGDLTSRLNFVEASLNITNIEQSTEKTSLSKEHTVLTSLLEQKSDMSQNMPLKSTPFSKKSQLYDIPCNNNNNNRNMVTSGTNDGINPLSLGSNITHTVQSDDMNNFKIEIVMELDKGMANAINGDSKYKIKISPDHFNNIRLNDNLSRIENNMSSVYVESFTASETTSSSYQIKSTNHQDDNHYENLKINTNDFTDVLNDTTKSLESTNDTDENLLIQEQERVSAQDSRHVSKEQRNDPEPAKQIRNNKHSRPRKNASNKVVDSVKFTSTIPNKQYTRLKEETYSKEEKSNKKRNSFSKYTSEETASKTENSCNSNQIIFKSHCSEGRNDTLTSLAESQLGHSGNLVDQLNECFKIKESTHQRIDNEDDDVILLEEKRNSITEMKPDNVNENEASMQIIKSDTNNFGNNNFFLISNDSSKDKQNVKYLILNNNNLFKTLNFDGANKQTNSIVSNTEHGQQTNFLLVNNDKNGNLFLLNKDVKQSNNFVFNNNGLYNPCDTQYFIINDTNTNFQQQVINNPQSRSATPASTLNLSPVCDNSQLGTQSEEQMKLSMDTNDDLMKNCTESYDPDLTCDKTMENTADMLMLSQETPIDTKNTNKDLIQNKENILIVNNHLNEEHFKFDSNDSGVQIRMDDSMYSLNEKISNELKMGGKCSEIPQIYFINDLDSPLSISNDYGVDSDMKEVPPGGQVELLNYDDLLLKNETPQTVTSCDSNMNGVVDSTAQPNEKYNMLPLLNSNGMGEKTPSSQVKTMKINQPEQVDTSQKRDLKTLDAKQKSVPAKSKLTSLKQNSSSFLKHLKSKLEKQKPVSKNQILNKAPSNYLHKNAPIVKKVKLDDMDSVLTNDPVENASKILALCMKKESEAQQKSLSCHICSMVFCDAIVLNKHVEEHSTLGKFTCTVCKKVFNNMKSLKTHSRIHTGEKPFRCSVCGKSFSQRGILSSHLAVHAGVKPHICKQCGHAFTQKSQLRLHEMRHGNIRHFACNTCPFKFTTKSDLQRHQRSHEGVKPFRCEYCDKTFTRQIIMKEHQNRHKGLQPYSCSHCDKTFFDAQGLNKHKLSHKTPRTDNPTSVKVMNGSKLFGGIG